MKYTHNSVYNQYTLQSYKKHLEKLYETAREGKDPNCNKCDEYGFKKISTNIFSNRKVPEICDCVKEEKTLIAREIASLENKIKVYEKIFSSLDNDISLDIFESRFKQKELVSSIKKYLELGSTISLYLEGRSGVGKTTILKILWQIYTLNNIKVLYMKASDFEDLYKNLFNRNADRDIQSKINAKIDLVKEAQIIMIDDIDSIGFHYAVEGYYRIFDILRASEKRALLSSNKSYSHLLSSLNVRNRKDNIEEIKGRLTSRLLNLNIIELEIKKLSSVRGKLA